MTCSVEVDAIDSFRLLWTLFNELAIKTPTFGMVAYFTYRKGSSQATFRLQIHIPVLWLFSG